LIKMVLIKAIRIYQIFVSPVMPGKCRFYPSCSNYVIDALEKYGVLKGLWLGVKRILKCHPFHAGGYDPIR